MFKKMSIGQKLYAGFGLLALMVIGMMLFAIGQLSRIYSVTDNITNNMLPSLQYASAMQESLLNTRRSEMGAIIGYHDHNPDDINGSIASFENYARAFSEAQQAYSQLPFSSELEHQTFAQLGTEAN
ncbi:MAG: MCP four helix bundle domain-containing protein, partial [Aeromonas sp.]